MATKKPANQPSTLSAQTLQLKDLAKKPKPGAAIPMDVINLLIRDFTLQKEIIEMYAAHMSATDRKHLNGVGLKKQGFIDRAYMMAVENQEFLPHWLTIEKFRGDNERSAGLRTLFALHDQSEEMLLNLVMKSADMSCTDALAFYHSVRDAAKHRIDAAESLRAELYEFFRSHGKRNGKLTEKKLKRDENALLKGKKSGTVAVENVSPKAVGGSRKVVDDTYKDNV